MAGDLLPSVLAVWHLGFRFREAARGPCTSRHTARRNTTWRLMSMCSLPAGVQSS